MIVSTWLPAVVVSIMSRTALPTPSGSPSSDLQADPILGARGQVKDELATRIEEQRAKIRALELAVEERRRADQVRIQERARETESIKQELRQRLLVAVSTEDRLVLNRRQEELRCEDRLCQKETGLRSVLGHKASVADDAEDAFRQRQALSNQEEEQLREDKLERDGLAMQALFHQKVEERRLATIREREQRKEERRLVEVREKEVRDRASYKAAVRAREQGQLLACQQDDQRRREREARDRACLAAHERHKAAAKAKKAQEVEARSLAKLREKAAAKARKAREAEERKREKLREAEQKQALRVQRSRSAD